jgi:hypothetical protein
LADFEVASRIAHVQPVKGLQLHSAHNRMADVFFGSALRLDTDSQSRDEFTLALGDLNRDE